MVRNYSIYLPSFQGSIEQEWEQCLGQIFENAREGIKFLKLNIFISVPDFQSYILTKDLIGKSVVKTFGEASPSFNVSIHPPEKPWKVAVEALFIREQSVAVTTKYLNSLPYVVIESDSFKEVWGAGLGNDRHIDDTRQAAGAAFDMINEILLRENMTMNHIVRQWNFIGNILEINNGFQNYQVFNEVRNEYYTRYRSVPGYPAATGVGMKHGGVYLDFCAVKSVDSIKLRPIDNPNQINAYQYGQQVLKGSVLKGRTAKNPPQFERALLMINRTSGTIFVSGTASIIGQETIGKGDVAEQTLVTIENIKKLTDSERISRLTGNQEPVTGRFSVIRVYVKRQEDFRIVRDICNDHFPDTPALFIESDICRDELLTEIEAEVMIR